MCAIVSAHFNFFISEGFHQSLKCIYKGLLCIIETGLSSRVAAWQTAGCVYIWNQNSYRLGEMLGGGAR